MKSFIWSMGETIQVMVVLSWALAQVVKVSDGVLIGNRSLSCVDEITYHMVVVFLETLVSF